jgi:ribosomal protein L29
MKKTELTDIKALDIKSLKGKAKSLRDDIAEMTLQKNMQSLKDTKSIHKTKVDLAQVMTILKQKELLELLEIDEKKEKEEKGA